MPVFTFLPLQMSSIPSRTAAKVLVDQLVLHGTKRVFCVPGESYLPVLDALYERREAIALTVNRHESGASFMAEAWGKLTGTAGVCFVTRGPGATNASIGVHTAYQDSTPLILFIGQVGSDCIDREAFQEIDYRRMFGDFCKWVAQIDSADRITEYVARAYHVAMSGRAGPVVLALPEDMLQREVAVRDARPAQPVQGEVGQSQARALATALAAAQRPLVIVGGSGWTPKACTDLETFARKHDLPVAWSFRRQDIFDNRHPNYVGDVGIGINPRLAKRVREADVLLALGVRLGEMTTSGYTLLDIPVPRQKLLHVHPHAEELGHVYQPDIAIEASMPAIATMLKDLQPPAAPVWKDETSLAREDYLAWQKEPEIFGTRPQALNLWRVVKHLFERLPEDTLLANGAGNFATWGHRYRQYPGYSTGKRSQLAPTSGAMGYGVPAGIAAQLFDPQRQVVVIAGDGDFLMTGQELATAAAANARVLFIVVNNGMYGTIRMHQEMHYPQRVYGTALSNPDFVGLARAYGLVAERARTLEDFYSALDQILAAMADKSCPGLIELITDPEIISPGATVASLRNRR
jgi:acetolactate synthase-1/2/3 large subunit